MEFDRVIGCRISDRNTIYDLELHMRFPLRDAYSFGDRNGLSTESAAIREMEIEWDRSYDSTVRRGRMIALFESRVYLTSLCAMCGP